ncbi:plexin-C1-like isoform X1 [Electrophorus electricus]|uniref:plexin-C1-like isoform X1 n=1 Tax=Electrophorus electricus TaxID=8005 RepID=UPI0015D0A408|nr:plexin-C1-like isoform X1 [Electrophorus electricus]
MRAVFLGILILFKYGVYALEYNFKGEIRNFVVGQGKVYVVTDSRLHQMRLDLVEEKFKDLPNHTHPNKVNILLPFDANGTLIVCGSDTSGYCEVLDINDITKTIYREALSVVPLVDKSSMAFLVDFDQSNGVQSRGAYLLVAGENEDKAKKYTGCNFQGGVTLWNTLHSQTGDIFSTTASEPTDSCVIVKDVEWVDGFQTSSHSHSYLFLNIKSATAPSVVLLRMHNSRKKSKMTRSLKGARLQCCEDKPRRKLLSSAVISSGSPLLWVGIFTAQEEHDDTALAIFDISDPGNQVPSDFECSPKCAEVKRDKVLKPQSEVFKVSSMTSVAAQKKGSWIVLYIGTGNGQLIKLVLDKSFRPGCMKVLYRSDDDRMLFSRMYFDPVDHKCIYIVLRNQIRRVAVTQCGMYSTLRHCRSSQDPLCGWCMNTSKCSTQDECSNSTWISIPDDSFQKELISFQVAKHSGNSEAGMDVPYSKYTSAPTEKWTSSERFCSSGSQDVDLMGAIRKMNAGHKKNNFVQLTVTLHLSVEATGHCPLSCTFKSGSKDLCDSLPTAVFPKCSCSFSSQDLPSKGLQVTATVTIGDETLTESLKLRNCPDISESSPYAKCTACVSSGCHWNSSNQTCTWNHGSAPQVHMEDMCKQLTARKNYTPEIISLWPSQVSFHGKNNAVMKGKNLEQVVKILLQGIMACNSKEIPVLERSTDTLRFHIPNGNKGSVRVCVVTADGSCHSNATITYGSQPTCTGLQPRLTWASGERQIHVLGTNLEYAEAVTVHLSSKEIILNSANKSFWFHSDIMREYQAPGPFSVSLRVGNITVPCTETLYYHPDPEFTSFGTSLDDNDVLITIQKNEDRLNLSMKEVNVLGLQKEEPFPCLILEIKSTAVLCKIVGGKAISVDSLRIEFGSIKKTLQMKTFVHKIHLYILVILIVLILLGAIAGGLAVHHLWGRETAQQGRDDPAERQPG